MNESDMTQLKKQCISILSESIDSNDFWTAMHAAEGLADAGMKNLVLKKLPGRLKCELDACKRCVLARELVRSGDKSQIKVVLDILGDADTVGHAHAAECFYKLGVEGGTDLLLKAAQQNELLKVKAFAAGALARQGNKAGLTLLRLLVTNGDIDTASLASFMLGSVGDGSDIKNISVLLTKATKPLQQLFIYGSLACLNDSESVHHLRIRLEETDDNSIRALGIWMLNQSRHLEIDNKVKSWLNSEAEDVRVRVAHAILCVSE